MSEKDFIEFHAEARHFCSKIDLYGRMDEKTALMPFIVEQIPESEHIRPIEISMRTAQSLVDALYRAGVVPSKLREENRSDIKAHLEDMRRIVFKTIEGGGK